MKTKRHSLIQLVLSVLLTVVPLQAQERVAVSPTGTTIVRAKFNQTDINVTIRTVRINRSHSSFPTQFLWDAKEATLISSLVITVNGKQVFVPRSVFLDVFDPHEASLELLSGRLTLRITEADASNSAFLLVYFDTTRVTQRMVFSQLDPNKATEDTRYSLKIVEDK
jgi:hypothetical protein